MPTFITGKQQGFTLLEVVIVLILMGITIGIILPSFDAVFDSMADKTTQRKVINLFERIRNEAITSNTTQVIEVNSDRLIYKSKIGEELDFSEGIKRVRLKNKKEDEISFAPDGTSSGGILNFTLDNGNEFNLIIDSVDGEVELEE